MSTFLLAWPEAAALLVPAALLWWQLGRRGPGRLMRAAMLALLVAAATGPELAWDRGGSDVVLVLDRSASMGEARAAQDELVQLAADARRSGDRLGVVVFGDGAGVAQAPQATGRPRLTDRPVGDSGSDLVDALALADALIAPGRSGRVLVHSDGELTGPSPQGAAAALALRGVPVDALPVARPPLPDAGVARIELPASLALGESFMAAAVVVGDAVERRGWQVVRHDERGAHVVARGQVELGPGLEVAVTFADRPAAPGVVTYEVTLEGQDRVPGNDVGRAALRVTGGERVLVMGGDGSAGNLARAVQAAGFEVVTRPEGPVTLEELLGYRALVLEQVPADRLGLPAMTAIGQWVRHFGGGLVLTGGRRGFGAGGYHKSPIEEVLPVTLELRDEHRQMAVAMALTLDRSGSMAATTDDGRTKMDLANAGVAAAIELLGPHDEVAVHAVDTRAHVVVPLTAASDTASLVGAVAGIRSEGGGIYVYEALVEAGKELLRSDKGTRHLVLFADAADAEEPGDYRRLLDEYRAAGITVSVIGLGSEADPDAALLADIAQRGGGRLSFTSRAEDLPRVFAQETVLVARSAWVDAPVTLVREPALTALLGPSEALGGPWPSVPGYNLTYARPRATVLATAPGDPTGPAVAAWRVGTGHAVALAFDLDDPKAPGLLAWPGYAPLVSSLVRWASGAGQSALGTLSAERAGRHVTLRLELDPDAHRAWPVAAPQVALARPGQLGDPALLPLQPVDAGRYEATFRLADDQPVLPSAILTPADAPDRPVAIHGPALRLATSPETEPRLGRPPGAQALARLTQATRGAVRADLHGLYDNPPSRGTLAPLAPWLVALALALLLLEIATRRMDLRWRRPRRAAPRPEPLRAPRATPAPAAEAPTPTSPTQPPPPQPTQGLHEALRELQKRGRR